MYNPGAYARPEAFVSLGQGEFVFLPGTERRRKIEAPAPAAPAGDPDGGAPGRRAAGPLEADPPPGAGVPAVARLRVPGLQAAAQQDRARQRRLRAAGARYGAVAAAAAHVPGAEMGRPPAQDERVPAGAVGWRAAAHRDRPRARQ